MASKRFAKKISKRIGKFTMVLSFVVLVPGWILLYLIAYFLFSIDLCGKLYVDNKDKANACYDKHFRLLLKMDKHELINMFTKNRIMSYDKLDQRAVNDVYEALAFLDYVFTKHNIQYSIDWGTEMGSIRHGGFIPWDDDVDLVVLEDEDKMATAIKKEIKLNKVEDRFTYARYKDDGSLKIIPTLEMENVTVDLFPNLVKCKRYYKKQVYNYNFKYIGCGTTFPELYYVNLSEIYPLKRCKFGPLELVCKNNVVEAFNRTYGKDWMDVAYTENHSFNNGRNKKIKLTQELRKPALPTNDAWKKWVDLKNNLKQK